MELARCSRVPVSPYAETDRARAGFHCDARATADTARIHKDTLVAHGLQSTFLDDLKGGIAKLETSALQARVDPSAISYSCTKAALGPDRAGRIHRHSAARRYHACHRRDCNEHGWHREKGERIARAHSEELAPEDARQHAGAHRSRWSV